MRPEYTKKKRVKSVNRMAIAGNKNITLLFESGHVCEDVTQGRRKGQKMFKCRCR